MLKRVTWSDSRVYRSYAKHEPIEFYLKALSNSSSFDLLLGYFSSSAINVLSLGFASFIYNGGKVRIVANHILSKKDKEILIAAESGTYDETIIDLSNINQLRNNLDDYGIHFFNCLAYLIAKKRIEIVLVTPKEGKGISHYKSGNFSDGKNIVGFKASCNFTYSGISQNLEEVEVFLSWENNRSTKLIESQKSYFEMIFDKKADFVKYIDPEDIQEAIHNKFQDRSIEELLINEKELLNAKRNILENKNLIKVIAEQEAKINLIANTPRFPFITGPRDYQKEAYSNWVKNNKNGIFAMATGTGKTITSLNCLLNEYISTGIYNCLILVPTITLVNQWVNEAKAFNFKNIYCISSKNRWKKSVTTMLASLKRNNKSFIIISTYASFATDTFQSLLPLIPSSSLLIADEGHNIASPTIRELLDKVRIENRIGLSATPKRVYDEEGTRAMEEFFNDNEPYTYVFSMERAIKEGILTKYNYYPHIIKLTSEEFQEYNNLTKKLVRFFDSKTGSFKEGAEIILLKRKRIIHKAKNKLKATRQLLADRYEAQGNLRYTFVYVPEGIVSSEYDLSEDWYEDPKIIDVYTREIALIDETITVNKFVSGLKERDEILSQFQLGEIQVLASMKCLDEGVDIPRAEHAIFCSSTGNPRQFIQRRGRILRKHKDKNVATIHDLVVIPDSQEAETYEVEKRLVEKELERVMYFASLAQNPLYTEDIFENICQYYGLNIYTIQSNLSTQ